MKFKFKLASVKKHRALLKDLAQKDFELARLAVEKKLSEINLMYQSIDQARLRSDELQSRPEAQSAPLQQIEEFIVGQGLRIQKARLEVRELMAVQEEKQEILIEKVKDLKMLEKLEDKKRLEFKKELNKKNQIEADDMSIMRFERTKGSL